MLKSTVLMSHLSVFTNILVLWQEGRLRWMIYSGGEFHDALIFGMTREEFEATDWNPE